MYLQQFKPGAFSKLREGQQGHILTSQLQVAPINTIPINILTI